MPRGIYVRTLQNKINIGLASKGRKHSKKTKNKISEIRKKNPVKSIYKKGDNIGNKNWNWKGDNVGYDGIHAWVHNWLGKATYCSNDKTHKAARFEWSNKSRKYKRDLTDWESLCSKCHRKEDAIYRKIMKKYCKNIRFILQGQNNG
ncbi:MAG: hypothetical protein PHE73_09185 [Sulfurovaceae bacterium]|nr:hypothetical protein [Sulfurovaceae bacterium]